MVYEYGVMKRQRSREKVLISLKTGPKRFKDLEKETELSAAGLNDIRKILLEEKVIESTLLDGKSAYKITKKGKDSLLKYNNLSFDINEIKSRDGVYFRDHSTLNGGINTSKLSWGIRSDLTVDKKINKLNLLSSDDVVDIEKLVYEKLKKNISKNKLKKNEIGKLILGFSIDYSQLLQSINEKALEYYEIMSKEEITLLNKMDADIESLTEKDKKRLETLRSKTYKKL
jgi:predicted transcriptional regulator